MAYASSDEPTQHWGRRGIVPEKTSTPKEIKVLQASQTSLALAEFCEGKHTYDHLESNGYCGGVITRDLPIFNLLGDTF